MANGQNSVIYSKHVAVLDQLTTKKILWLLVVAKIENSKLESYWMSNYSVLFSMSEVWNLETLEHRQVQPMMTNYAYYPEMFLVPDDFCAR